MKRCGRSWCGHPEVGHTAGGTACYADGCKCDRFLPIPATLEDYHEVRYLGDGRWLCLMKLTFGRMRLVVAPDEFTAGEHW